MRKLENINEVNAFIKENELAFLYISTSTCSVCHALKPKVEQLLIKFPDIKTGYIDAEELTEVAGRFSIFTVPVLLLFVNEKETLRKARIVHLDELERDIHKIVSLFKA
ncbi:thioredoxin family protein [Bacillus taeanensis]|uniref:Thioredoxin n=1 Tax=Bacillus taeanensis TaxID=273032 RepID=A0A366Y3B3_9BACI|nr:thioredoxin family protein [Bacillus taeanensis]RBW70893.1 thioredoxin [Bacillus taeanensis]